MNFISSQAKKYSLVINWQLESTILEKVLTNFSKVYVIYLKTAILKVVNVETYCEESTRDAFISGLSSNLIRQRFLEDQSLTLKTAYNQARNLDLAQKNSEEFVTNVTPVYSAVTSGAEDEKDSIATANPGRNTYFCKSNRYSRKNCSARGAFCNKCEKKGHFEKVCQSKRGAVSAVMHQTNNNASQSFLAAVTAGVPSSFSNAIDHAFIKNTKFSALIDIGSSENFISSKPIAELKISYVISRKSIKPDPKRLEPLRNMHPPKDHNSKQRVFHKKH